MSVSDRYRRFSEGVPKWVGWDGFGNFIAIKLTDITAQPLSGWDGLDGMGWIGWVGCGHLLFRTALWC